MHLRTMRTPLAKKLRPQTLDEIVGQEHILGEGCTLRKIIENDTLGSIILYGPAGTGKTTIAEVIANSTSREFVRINATSASIKDIRKAGNDAVNHEEDVVVFVDEVHRFSKTQQDALLPFVEDGNIIFIGATTENPYFTINASLVSRSQMVYELFPLKPAQLFKVLQRGLDYYESEGRPITISKGAAKHVLSVASGDARKVLSLLEVAVSISEGGSVTEDDVRQLAPSKHMVFSEEVHYDLASAYQGSIQASDPDAAIYWLAKWLESGEDPRYIARRLLVSAAEDAHSNPICTSIAHAAFTAAEKIGRPECDIVLAQATIYVAQSPRNKTAANAIWAAVSDVKKDIDIEIPMELRDCSYKSASKLGHGEFQEGHNIDKYVGVNKTYVRDQ